MHPNEQVLLASKRTETPSQLLLEFTQEYLIVRPTRKNCKSKTILNNASFLHFILNCDCIKES